MPRPPFDPATDYYGLLGVPQDAPPDEIHAAYRRLAKAHHPDLNAGSARAAARMARLNVAKAVLLHGPTRAAYDAERRLRYGASPAMPAVSANGTSHAAPIIRPAPPPRRVAPRPTPTADDRRLDRQSALMLAAAFPFLVAVALYMAGSLQLASRPVPQASRDLSLAPMSRPAVQGVARAAHSIVAGQSPSRVAARGASNIIQTLVDGSPEAELLRTTGRRLVQAASDGDAAAWSRAVGDLCRLAEEC